MDNNKNKGQNPNQGGQQGQGRHDKKNDPVASDNNPPAKSGQQDQGQERSQSQPNQGQKERQGQESGREEGSQSGSQRNITNQDQQRQPTNAGDSGQPMGEEETEGDRQQDERLKPYKNVGDDSEEVEKKTPTME